jgi:Fe-S-cluster-containing hydrogenase component 2
MNENGQPKKRRKPRQSVVKQHDTFPPNCSKCGSNELTNIGNVKQGPEYFKRNGVEYTHAKRYYGRCVGCGQTWMICQRIRRVQK